MNRLGIDIGRVIIAGSSGPGDTSFFSGDAAAMLRTPAVPGAFEAIARLVPLFDETWLVSKCGPRVQRRSLEWLRDHRFFERTGVPAGNVRFCLRRPEKAVHCAELGITHFVDDKADVIAAIAAVVPHRYLFENWRATEAAVLRGLRGARAHAVARFVAGASWCRSAPRHENRAIRCRTGCGGRRGDAAQGQDHQSCQRDQLLHRSSFPANQVGVILVTNAPEHHG